MLGFGAASLAIAISFPMPQMCNPKTETIQNHPAAGKNQGISEVYDYVQAHVKQRSSKIKKILTVNPDDNISIYVRIGISKEGNVVYHGAQVNCNGTGCKNVHETGLEGLQEEVSTLNAGLQKEDHEISIPVYID